MKALLQVPNRISALANRFESWIDSVDEKRFLHGCDIVMRGFAYFAGLFIVLTAIRALVSGAFDMEVR